MEIVREVTREKTRCGDKVGIIPDRSDDRSIPYGIACWQL